MLSKINGGLEDLGNADGYLDEILEIRDRIRLFEGCSQDEIQACCRYLRCFAAPRNHVLIEAGQGGNCLLLLLTGAAEAREYLPGSGSGIERMTVVVPGNTLGESSLVDGKPPTISCVTTMPSDFAVLTRMALNSLLLQDPRLGNKLLLALLGMLSDRCREPFKRELPCAIAEDCASRILCE